MAHVLHSMVVCKRCAHATKADWPAIRHSLETEPNCLDTTVDHGLILYTPVTPPRTT